MEYVVGLLIWTAIGLVAGALARMTYAADAAGAALTFIFAVSGALVGGMLGVSAYVFHDPEPLRVGGIIGAIVGSLFFAYLYHFAARRAL